MCALSSNFSTCLECSINMSFAFTSRENNVALSQRGVLSPCTSVITGENTTYIHVCPDIPDSREGENAAHTVALIFPQQQQQHPHHHHHPPCRGPLACQVQECVHSANAVMNLPLLPALSSSLESWWNVNINHVGRSTSKTLEGQRGIVLFYCFPNEGHADRMEIKWKKSQEICVFAVLPLQQQYRGSPQESPESSVFSLWYLVGCVSGAVSPNKQLSGIWQGRHCSGSRREVKRFLYVEIDWRGLVKGSKTEVQGEFGLPYLFML